MSAARPTPLPLLFALGAISLGLLPGTWSCSSGGSSPGTGAGGDGGGGGQTSVVDQALKDCQAACTLIDGLGCAKNKPGECAGLCESSAKVKACGAEFAAYSACAAGANWSCTNDLAQATECATPAKTFLDCFNAKGGGSGTPGAEGNFFCNEATCDGSKAERACCLKLDLSKGGIVARCASSLDECGQDSRWECDGPDDCGGRPCCWSNPSSGSGQIIIGLCRDACKPLAGEREVCQDTCTGGQFCCKRGDDKVGECVASQEICDTKASEQPLCADFSLVSRVV